MKRKTFRIPVTQPKSASGVAALQLTGVYHNLLRRWADV